MTKTTGKSTKISDLAKQLKLTPKDLISRLSEIGIGISSAKSTVDAFTVKKIKRALSKKKTAPSVKKPAKVKRIEKAKPIEKKVLKGKKPVKLEVKEEKSSPKPEEKPKVITAVQAAPEEKAVLTKKIRTKIPITIKDLASKMSVGPSLLIKKLMDIGVFATINQLVDEAIAKEVGEKFGFIIDPLPTIEQETMAVHEKEDQAKLEPRAPVVTFMGHVDHGKTSLLDYIRKSKITDFEKGGITQHIGAYRVHFEKGEITFLDTPGHEAFTAMRARGATVTDMVILVVAADDGIKPQTIEAIDHSRAASVPIIVAINKVDKQNIDIEKVKKQLSEFDLMPEDWGGKTITVNVSAKTGDGIDKLLEMILLEAEMLELKADPTKPARGIVIEGRLSKGGGPISTVLVESGTLYPGDIVVCGQHYGKVKALINDKIHKVKEAVPSMPVEILGINGIPQAGDPFFVVENEKRAKQIVESRIQKAKEESTGPIARKISLEDLYAEIEKGSVKELKLIVKTDVQGSVEALIDSLMKIDSKEIRLNIIHKGVGDVSESDVLLAAASNAIIIGLHTGKTQEADKAVKREGVDLKLYNIIYEAIAEVKAALEGMLEPKLKEQFMGKAIVRQVFKVSKAGTIAGCYVQKGNMKRIHQCRLMRNGQEVYSGKLSSLKRFKDDVKEVAEGYECGIALADFQTIQAGDIIETFEIQKITRKLK